MLPLHESIANVSLVAGNLLAEKVIQVDDSTELVYSAVKIAKDFEDMIKANPSIGDDYLAEIEKYAKFQLINEYGIDS